MSGHDHQHDISSERIGVVFFVNFFFTIIEFVGGLLTNSTAIMADAVHDPGVPCRSALPGFSTFSLQHTTIEFELAV